ncbi:MAG TPA: hypothetical protein VKG82_00940 [Solirubrobacteraceae bacterium]|nr:hypothetical protein [Solirubrobacteraceae bacterium]
MNGPTRVRVLCVGALCALGMALAMPVSGAFAETTVHYTKESQQEYEAQLAHGEIESATFNKRVRSLHLTLKNGTHVLYHYPPKDEPTLNAALVARHIPVTVLSSTQAKSETAKAPVHHKLRYIAGGILIAVVVIVGAVLLVDRRRKSMAE